MKPSPLEFARDFEKLKSELSRLPAADLRLLLLARFWERLAPVAGESAYKSYLNDYCSLVIGLVQPDALSDLTIDSLNRVRRVLNDLVDVSGTEAAPELRTAISTVTLRLATLFFYVGAMDEGLALCLQLKGGDDIALPTDSEIRGLSPLDTLRTIYDKYRRDYPELGTLLQGVLAKWEEDALAVEHDRVWCLFVDKDGKGNAATGRMRLLRGTVEQVAGKRKSSSLPIRGRQTPSSAPVPDTSTPRRVGACLPPSGDMVAFDNQVKTPDDPFIGVAYDSLKAVRTGLRSAGFAQRAEGSYRAFLSVDGSNRTFTGDSIGLAVALVSFTQLLKPEVMRQERFIASDIAVTGSIDAEGRITPVNNDSIAAKIERAFFSHVRYVVLPEANLATARDTVKRLSKQYRRRRLRLVSAAHLDDVLNDRNIIRSEKVCLGAFITKKAARYSRATKVQVPLLLMLLYALICIIYPKAWIGFDWNPEYVRLTERGFEALNRDSVSLWDVEYECEGITSASMWEIGDIDGNGKNNILVAPKAANTASCDVSANVIVYDDKGAELWRRHMAKQCEYPADTTVDPLWSPVGIRIIETDTAPFLLTAVTRSYPAAAHIRMWSASGDSIGWYIHGGAIDLSNRLFSNARDTGLIIGGINNWMECASLFVLPRKSPQGVSPPYTDSACDLTWVKRGNHLTYILFPASDLSSLQGHLYNGTSEIVVQSDSVLRVAVWEGRADGDSEALLLDYFLDSDFRVVTAKAGDAFRAARDKRVADGDLPPHAWPSYLDSMRNAVLYWTDSGWVTEGQLRKTEGK